MTSINEPTEAVARFAEMKDWQLVVVGDTKTPVSWRHDKVVYLSPEQQKAMSSALVQALPWRTYARKMAGYIYAVQNGANLVAETDDDNIPYDFWDAHLHGECEQIQHPGFVNIYRYFSSEHVWPRGFPLDDIRTPVHPTPTRTAVSASDSIAIWQFLADEDPDVDAIYRLTNNKPVYFQKRGNLVLSAGTICPFNSQNTFFRPEAFPLLYLPVHVTFRFTDILRGLVAQPILWAAGRSLCFGHATVIQKRNPHDYLVDFESEIPCYLYPKRIVEAVQTAISGSNSVCENLLLAYEQLVRIRIVAKEEIPLVSAWVSHFSA